jgi:hypothetical protein
MTVSSGWSVQNKWNALFGVWALHGMFALGKFLTSQNSPFDLSVEEILLAVVLLFWVAPNLFLIFSCSRKYTWLTQILNLLKNPTARGRKQAGVSNAWADQRADCFPHVRAARLHSQCV